MKGKKVIIIILLVTVTIGLLGWLKSIRYTKNSQYIESSYSKGIVYRKPKIVLMNGELENEYEVSELKKDCLSKLGKFDECGGAYGRAMVCSLECRFLY